MTEMSVVFVPLNGAPGAPMHPMAQISHLYPQLAPQIQIPAQHGLMQPQIQFEHQPAMISGIKVFLIAVNLYYVLLLIPQISSW